MRFTPTSTSSAVAGAGLWLLLWSILFKIETIAKLLRLDSFVNKDRIIDWIDENKGLTLIGTEVFNFGVHGITNATSVTFALGGTVLNIFMVFCGLPLFRLTRMVGHLMGRGRSAVA